MRKSTFAAYMGASASLYCGVQALAQTAVGTDEAVLQEVTVTAQRREETLQRAALPVDVVTSEALAESGITNAADLNRLVPALAVITQGGANTSYYVRGVGNFTANGISDPAVGFNYDGVYVGRATGTTGTFFDLERIEVLKGPQGTLYGRNATAGAINVIPKRPQLDAYAGEVSLGAGNFGALNVNAALNVPLGTAAALRVAGIVAQHDGYNDDGTSDEDAKAARLQFLVEPGESLSIRLGADYYLGQGAGPGGHLDGHYAPSFGPPSPTLPGIPTVTNAFVPSNLRQDLGLLSPESQALFGTFVIGGAFIFPAPLAYPNPENTQWGVNAEISAQIPAGRLTVIPAYRKGHQTGGFNGPVFRAGEIDEVNEQTSIEARLQGKPLGMFDWLVGAYYFDEKIDALNGFNQYVVTAFLDYESGTESAAVFGRLIANLTDDVRLVAGARYTNDDKSIDGGIWQVIQGCGTFPPPPPFTAPPTFCFGGSSQPVALELSELIASGLIAPTPLTPSQFGAHPQSYLYWVVTPNVSTISNGKTTYRVGVEWNTGADSLLYAAYETGYRSGGFNLAFGRESFRPETIDAVTLGTKNRFLGNRLQLNGELFHWTYKDQQVSHFGANAAGNVAYFTENIGKSVILGADLDVQWLLTANTLVTLNAQYLDSEIKEFAFRSLEQGGGNVTGCAQTRVADRDINPLQPGNEIEYIVDCAGQRGYHSPKWSLDIGMQQTIPLGAQRIVLAADTSYRGESMKGFEFLPEEIAQAHWTTNASAALKSASDRWSIEAFVRNIEDKRYTALTQYSSAIGGAVVSTYTPPLTYGMRLSITF